MHVPIWNPSYSEEDVIREGGSLFMCLLFFRNKTEWMMSDSRLEELLLNNDDESDERTRTFLFQNIST